jgi:hypothetical protein
MRIKFSQKKGKRLSKGTIKLQGRDKRAPIFIGIENLDDHYLMWADTLNKWVGLSNQPDGDYSMCSIKAPIRSVKAAIRHIRKHDEIPKGARMVLVSSLVGCDVEIIK